MSQLLHLQNGDELLGKISAADGRLAALLSGGASDTQVVEDLFLATLARPPRDGETAAVMGAIAAEDARPEIFADLLWALLNSKEFAFNH